MKQPFMRRSIWPITVFGVLLAGCGSLKPTLTAAPVYYTLDNPTTAAGPVQSAAPDSSLTLLVNPPGAASGFDSRHIIYTRAAHQLEYFPQSEWIDTPSRMLGPIIIEVLGNSGRFHSVSPATGATAGNLRLNTQIVRLQHEFNTPAGQMRFTLRAWLIDNASREVLVYREFDELVVPPDDSTAAGIVAANQAVQKGLQELSVFCAAAAHQWLSRAP